MDDDPDMPLLDPRGPATRLRERLGEAGYRAYVRSAHLVVLREGWARGADGRFRDVEEVRTEMV